MYFCFMKNIKEILLFQTDSFKQEYLKQIENFAKQEFLQLKQWVKDYQNGKYGYDEASKKYWKLPSYIVNSSGNVSTHIKKLIDNANKHYEFSIDKLIERLKKKDLDINNITCTVNHIGVNLDITISDGKKTIYAYTIIAGGNIQKPHYRYLIK
jgi:hypothetical protein